ncbi:MAG: hypothetical protein KDC75_25855 [Phaeodactylibacter sp.]|nr:hypothetical protein [Phaeodactylibacter sp.]
MRIAGFDNYIIDIVIGPGHVVVFNVYNDIYIPRGGKVAEKSILLSSPGEVVSAYFRPVHRVSEKAAFRVFNVKDGISYGLLFGDIVEECHADVIGGIGGQVRQVGLKTGLVHLSFFQGC